MEGLEVVMDIMTLEIYEVIDHDKELHAEKNKEVEFIPIDKPIIYQQLNLFEELDLLNTS